MPSIELLRFVSSGTEAAMSAVRLARGFTGRDTVIKFAGCYHGHSDLLLADAGSGIATLGIPASPGVPAEATKHTLVLPFNDLAAVRTAIERHGDDLAAILVEPVAGNMGVVPPADRVPRGAAGGVRRLRCAAGVRRGDHRLSGRPRRRPGALRGAARPDGARQDRRRRAARGGVRRPRRRDGAARARRRRLSGRHALGESAGDGRGPRDARPAGRGGGLRAAGGHERRARAGPARGRRRRAGDDQPGRLDDDAVLPSGPGLRLRPGPRERHRALRGLLPGRARRRGVPGAVAVRVRVHLAEAHEARRRPGDVRRPRRSSPATA